VVDKETIYIWAYGGVYTDLSVAFAWHILCEKKKKQLHV